MSAESIVYRGSWPGKWSDLVSRFCARHELHLETAEGVEEVHEFVNRAFPSCLVLEGTSDTEEAFALCSDLKKDPFTADGCSKKKSSSHDHHSLMPLSGTEYVFWGSPWGRPCGRPLRALNKRDIGITRERRR